MVTLIGHKRFLLLGASAAVLVVALVPLVRQPHAKSRSPYIVGLPDRGATLFYETKQCGICHAVNGVGGHIAPDLAGSQPESPAMGWLTAKLWNHGPGMWRQFRRKDKPFPELEPREMADMLSFLYRASTLDSPGDPDSGRQVFIDKGCVNCHSVGTFGGTTAPELSRIVTTDDQTEWMSAMLNHAGSMVAPISNTLVRWPDFSGHEMNDLIAYVSSRPADTRAAQNARRIPGDADQGAKVFEERCAHCHAVNGKGGNLGPPLGPENSVPLSPASFASLMWNHAPAMLKSGSETKTPVPQLHGKDMNNLLAFLASLRYFEPSGSPTAGKDVFSKRGCAACHGQAAEGTQSGPPLKSGHQSYTAVTFASALWRHGPRMIDRAEAMGTPWPRLEPKDIGNIVSFLNDGAKPKPD
jgi:mono/diheme cytochrome c family protein